MMVSPFFGVPSISLTSPSAKCRLSRDFYADIQWWHSFFHHFNGRRPFLCQQPIADVQIDAYFQGGWFYHNFTLDSPELAGLHTNYKEVLAANFAAFRWAPCWRNQQVVIHSDNASAVHIINKGSTAHPIIKRALRQLFWISAMHDFRFTATYIQGKLNVLANAVSSLHQPTQCLSFYKHLCELMPQPQAHTLSLSHHMSSNNAASLCCRFPRPHIGKAIGKGDLLLQKPHIL